MTGWMLLAFGAGLLFSAIVVAFRRYTPLPADGPMVPDDRRPSEQSATPAPTTAAPMSFRPDPYHRWVQALDSAPHLAILGPTGAGKTLLAEAIIRSRTGKVLIIDPNYEEGDWGGLPVVTTDDEDSFAPIEAAFRAILAEMKQRVIQARRKDKTFAELTIVWDEVPETIEECKIAGELLRRIARRARRYKIRLILLTQGANVKALGLEGHGDVRRNFLWLRLGDEAREKLGELVRARRVRAELAETFNRQRYPALLEWRGGSYAIDTSEAPTLARQPLDQVRAWHVPETESPVPSDGNEQNGFSADHLRIAVWLAEARAQGQSLSAREVTRRLYPDKPAGGRLTVSVGEMIKQVEAALAVPCSVVSHAPPAPTAGQEQPGTPEQHPHRCDRSSTEADSHTTTEAIYADDTTANSGRL